MLVEENLIDGKWVPPGEDEFASLNPANPSDVVATARNSSESEVDQAVMAARKALPEWRRTPPPERAKIIMRAGEIMAATKDKLAQDIAWATAHKIEGTPLVLINGEQVAPLGPLLYALILTRGNADHPVFDGLPEGKIRDPHAGHGH